MRILFAGSPAIAVPSLKTLAEMECYSNDVQLTGLLTNPDSAQGRKSDLVPTEVSAAAADISAERQEKGLAPIRQLKFEKLGSVERTEIAALHCDLLVSFAYGRIFGPKFLALFPMGGINIHPSLLPRFRGPSPISAAILARDRETGITIQKLGLEMDAGDILAQERLTLNGRETTASLSETVAVRAAQMLKELIPSLIAGTAEPRPQIGEPVYCSLLKKQDGRLDWSLGADAIDAQIRAFNPWPLCFSYWKGEELYIVEGATVPGTVAEKVPGTITGTDKNYGIMVQTGDGVYAITRLQRKGKKELDWKAFLNGARDFIGSRLG